MESTEQFLKLLKSKSFHGLGSMQKYSNTFDEIESLNNKFILNELHHAIYEGNIHDICNHLNWFRNKKQKPVLTESEQYDFFLFYKNYLHQYPPDGMLRMAQFINAALDNFT